MIIYLVLRPSSQRLQASADTSAPGSVDGLVRPPPFPLSRPPCFCAREAGRRALCELRRHVAAVSAFGALVQKSALLCSSCTWVLLSGGYTVQH